MAGKATTILILCIALLILSVSVEEVGARSGKNSQGMQKESEENPDQYNEAVSSGHKGKESGVLGSFLGR